MMNDQQSVSLWLQDNAAWLQVAAAIFQAITGAIAIYVTLRAADRSARLAFELNEEKEGASLEEQVNLLRFSLVLEIERNVDDLNRFYDNFAITLAGEQDASAEELRQLTARQRFIALNMPDLSYRFWHSQQLSSLLPRALNREQIRNVNSIYAEFDRLAKMVKTFGEETSLRSKSSLRPPEEAASESSGPPSSLSGLKELLGEFEISLKDVQEKAAQLEAAIGKGGEDRYISEGANKSQNAIQTRLPGKIRTNT
jgi:hypothetical protein